jgi:Reverse transcriptase (RNA-dependent DNA polymerase)
LANGAVDARFVHNSQSLHQAGRFYGSIRARANRQGSELGQFDKAWSGVYVSVPRGFNQTGKVFKLKKSLYGLKQATRNFFLHLKIKLEVVGFQSQEDLDPCLFISDKVICLVYVNDALFFPPKMEYIDEND